MPKLVIDYKFAQAAGTDAANKRMRQAGRTSWDEEDFNHAAKVMNEMLAKA